MVGPDSDTTTAPATYRPGWYPDPVARFEFRFHNGAAWTADVSTTGIRYVDPLGLTPGGGGSRGSRNGAAIAAMVLGIVAVTLAWMPFIFVIGAICALVAIVMAVVVLIRRRHQSDHQASGRAFAIAGLVTGVAGLMLTVVGIALSVAVVDAVDAYNNPAAHKVELTDCKLEGSRATVVGTLENTSDSTADFVVTVSFTRPGTNNTHRTANTSIENLPAGETAPFEISRQVRLDDVDCRISVTGPLPFGLDIE